jgi:hypothetical protein
VEYFLIHFYNRQFLSKFIIGIFFQNFLLQFLDLKKAVLNNKEVDSQLISALRALILDTVTYTSCITLYSMFRDDLKLKKKLLHS